MLCVSCFTSKKSIQQLHPHDKCVIHTERHQDIQFVNTVESLAYILFLLWHQQLGFHLFITILSVGLFFRFYSWHLHYIVERQQHKMSTEIFSRCSSSSAIQTLQIFFTIFNISFCSSSFSPSPPPLSFLLALTCFFTVALHRSLFFVTIILIFSKYVFGSQAYAMQTSYCIYMQQLPCFSHVIMTDDCKPLRVDMCCDSFNHMVDF